MTCAKKRVTCIIETPDGHIFEGSNDCDTPVKVCPRLPNEGYEKCKSICNQPGHAEEMAIKAAEDAGYTLIGATAYIGGIDHYCKNCQIKLRQAGVDSLRWIR